MSDICGICRASIGTPEQPEICKCPGVQAKPSPEYIDELARDTLAIAADIDKISAGKRKRGRPPLRPWRRNAVLSQDLHVDYEQILDEISKEEVK